MLAHPEDALDLMTPVVGFASVNATALDDDGLLGAARDALRACLGSLTADFEVTHFDAEACAAKGWWMSSFDHVVHQEAVCVGLTDLVRFGAHADLAVELVGAMAHHGGDPIRAAWFLECARSIDDVYKPPDHPPIRALLSDRALLEAAANVVRADVAPREASPTYWRDTFAALHLPPLADA